MCCRIANSHNAPWLTNFQTAMFSVNAGNAQSSCLVGRMVQWQAVRPHTWASSTETSIPETLVCPWNEACPGAGFAIMWSDSPNNVQTCFSP